jgi:hypothetical protein
MVLQLSFEHLEALILLIRFLGGGFMFLVLLTDLLFSGFHNVYRDFVQNFQDQLKERIVFIWIILKFCFFFHYHHVILDTDKFCSRNFISNLVAQRDLLLILCFGFCRTNFSDLLANVLYFPQSWAVKKQ